jgi:single-strand DNA-binding protein
MRSVNRITLVGNIGTDVEIRHTGAGTAVTNLQLATNSRKDDDGNERVDWHRLVFFGNKALLAEEFIKKGDRIYIEGRVQYSSYERVLESGETVQWPTTDIWVNEVVFLSPKS